MPGEMPGEMPGGYFPLVFPQRFGRVREKENLTPRRLHEVSQVLSKYVWITIYELRFNLSLNLNVRSGRRNPSDTK